LLVLKPVKNWQVKCNLKITDYKELHPVFDRAEFFIHRFTNQSNPLNKIIMGRGDKKTAKGKRFKGSFGKSRPVTKSPAKKISTAKKTAEKKTAEKK
jgi:30S ribosomal protein S31